MARWRVDLNKGGVVGKTSAGGFSNDTIFCGLAVYHLKND
jgi:hypothetical protein